MDCGKIEPITEKGILMGFRQTIEELESKNLKNLKTIREHTETTDLVTVFL
jgi:hypothetical protein